MAETQLTTGGSAGSQTTTQNPQTAGQPTNAAQSSSLQPGTATEALTQQNGGIPLTATALPSVGLTKTAATTVARPAAPARDVNPALVSIPVILVVAAIAMVWFIRSSAKNTTYS